MISCSSESVCTPFETWSIYTSLSLHFNKSNSYDAFKFNFKGPRCKRETFMSSRHRYFFEKVTKKYRYKNQIIEFFLANILDGNSYSSNMNDESHSRWTARVQRMNYEFKSTMIDLANEYESFDHIIIPSNKESLPPIYSAYNQNKISLETLVILDYLVQYTKNINKFVNDPLEIVDDMTYRIIAYKPFLKSKIDIKQAKETVLKLFTYVNN